MTEQDIVELLANHWNTCGVKNGDVLLVHSSIKQLLLKLKEQYEIDVTPKIIYDSFGFALGNEGTLILPLFNFDFPNSKVFDIRNTPSQMGALTEIARTDKDAVRTGHPIYSFSIKGKYANEFKGINNYSGYGADSPFAKIKELNGKIAIIGLTDQNSMTSYHFVEEQNKVDYRYFKKFEGLYTDWTGEEMHKTYALFVRDLERGVLTDVNRMMDRLWVNGFYKGEKYNEGFGMRTITFADLYNETEKVIQNGEAINFLYSIKKN